MDVADGDAAPSSENTKDNEQSPSNNDEVDNISISSDIEDYNENWYYMPDPILLTIFKLLTPKELVTAGCVCKPWNRVSKDEFLWKDLFYQTYKIEPSVGIMPGKNQKS